MKNLNSNFRSAKGEALIEHMFMVVLIIVLALPSLRFCFEQQTWHAFKWASDGLDGGTKGTGK